MKRLLLIALLISFSYSAKSQLVKPKIDSLLNSFVRQARIPSLSVAISMGNQIVYENAWGLQDVQQHIPATIRTLYRIGSITKLFTATTFIKLQDKGLFTETSKATEFISGLPSAYQAITLSELAAHTSGIRHYTRSEIFTKNTTDYKKLEDGLPRFTKDTLLFSPGEKYLYSSYGYILLGTALENSTHTNFNTLLKQEIFVPARMKSTFPETPEANNAKSIFYYPGNADSLTIATGDNYSYKWPAGGYLSTPSDLVRFGSALLDGKIISRELLQQLVKPRKTNNGKETGVAYGFRIGEDSRGRRVLHHGGESEGSRSFLLLYPDEKLSIALCSNLYRAPLFEGEAETIAGYFLGDYITTKNTLPPGQFSYTTTSNKKELKGKIDIYGNQGVIHNFNNADLPIIDIVVDKDKIRLITTSASGLVNFWLTKEGTTYKGSWGYDKPTTAISLD